ncbi:MAG: pyridoxal-phosphate dependent enzyme [Phycisphaerales bacterium]|nr:MAG: pyridoxal-phosphate dependent enzyme [Phycisphaerales bacterium]
MEYAADINAVREAARRIAPFIHRTPVMTSEAVNHIAGRELFFKCENFQKVGAFKMRGASNAVMKLPDEVAKRGVVTHSSGNFAQALALAAKLRGIEAHIVMPRTAPSVKRLAVEGYGATIYQCEPTLVAREATAAEVIEKTGGTLLHPYNHPDIIAGQGTCALELLEEVPDLDAIIAPIGGGGLMSGICIAARAIDPNITLIAAEPAGADDAYRSFQTGELIPQTGPNTIADGLLTSLGDLTWPIVRDYLRCIITVEDDRIIEAMRLIWQRMKIIIEPSAAVPVAAVMSDGFASMSNLKRVGIVLSGGNVDLDRLPW